MGIIQQGMGVVKLPQKGAPREKMAAADDKPKV